MDIDDNDDENVENWFNKPIYSEASVNGGDALCQILRVYVENRLTKKALKDLLITLTFLLPEDHIIPKNQYRLLLLIEKILPHSQNDFSIKHRMCAECCNYLGIWTEVQIENCLRCNSKDVNSFFLEFNLETELRNAFELRNLCDLIDDFQAECANRNQEKIYDFTSGSEYIRLKDTVLRGQYDIWMIWYTDGAQVSKSGRSQIWPVYAQVVNIHPKFRRSFQFVCGLFYSNQCSKSKPDMNSFLTPFATTLRNLFLDGFSWFNRRLNTLVSSKVLAVVASLDSPASSSVKNVMPYNGEYGCGSCETKGNSSIIDGGRRWTFPVDPSNPPLRSAERMEKQAEIADRFESLKHYKGVKGKSILTSIPHFDRSKGLPPDYLHSALLGVMLFLLNLWCSSKSHEKGYYLPRKERDEIDKILESIAPPDNVTRIPRKLSKLADWKGSELRAFLLYYGSVVLKGRLVDEYYEHFLLFVRSIHILSSEEIDPSELDLAKTLLNIFVIDFERLYERECTSNLHQLLHFADYVKMWGPLWVCSAFTSNY